MLLFRVPDLTSHFAGTMCGFTRHRTPAELRIRRDVVCIAGPGNGYVPWTSSWRRDQDRICSSSVDSRANADFSQNSRAGTAHEYTGEHRGQP